MNPSNTREKCNNNAPVSSKLTTKVRNPGIGDLNVRVESRHGGERSECKIGDLCTNGTSVCVVRVFAVNIPSRA